MSKKTIKLKSGELRKIINESVRSMLSELNWKGYMPQLKEESYREAPLKNDAGEVIDTGGYYNPDDYYDEDGLGSYTYPTDNIDSICKSIYNGEYDDKLDSLTAEDFGFDWDDYESGQVIGDAIHDRHCVIDKNYAMKHGKQPNTFDKGTVMHQSYYPDDENRNVRTRNHSRALDRENWKEHDAEYINKILPSLYKKNGQLRNTKKMKDIEGLVDKDLIGTDQYNKRPLHRKGSLNREV